MDETTATSDDRPASEQQPKPAAGYQPPAHAAALRALGAYTGVDDPARTWWNLDMPKALGIMLPAVAQTVIDAIKRDARDDVAWQREHKQNHEDLVRIVATEDAYNAALRTLAREFGL